MFGIGTPELVVIIIVGLIILGPGKLPEVMKALGKGIAEFRRMSNDVKRTLETEIDRADQDRRKEEAKRELFPDGVPPEKPTIDVAASSPERYPHEDAAEKAEATKQGVGLADKVQDVPSTYPEMQAKRDELGAKAVAANPDAVEKGEVGQAAAKAKPAGQAGTAGSTGEDKGKA